MTADELYAPVRRATDAEDRLRLPAMTGWEIVPFEQDSLQVLPESGAPLVLKLLPAGFRQLRAQALAARDGGVVAR